MVVQIIRVRPETVATALNIEIDLPTVAYVGIDDGKIVGSGGLAWGGGRCWLWLSTVETKPAYTFPLLKSARRLLRTAVQLGEREVFTPRDTQYPSSARLLRLLGFEPFGIESGQEVHIWRH